MPAGRPQRVQPVDAAVVRLMGLAAKGVQPARMAREVEIIAGEWQRALDSDPAEITGRLDDFFGHLVAAVEDTEEWLAEVDRSEPNAVRQARATLEAVVATREAAQRAWVALCV